MKKNNRSLESEKAEECDRPTDDVSSCSVDNK